MSSTVLSQEPERRVDSYALRLGDGLEFAEFSPTLWRLSVYHVLGVSRQVSLGYAEAYLLEYFITHPGEMTSRQELLDHAWADRMVSQGSLNQAISNLRALLGDDQKREIILTVPRRGYQFSAEALMDWKDWLTRKEAILGVADAPAEASSEVAVLPAGPVVAPGRWQMPTLWGLSAILALALLTGVLSSYFYTLFPPFASTRFDTQQTRVTLIARNQDELQSTKNFVQPVLQRLDALGGGRVLINRLYDYLELHCLRPDGTLHTLLVHAKRLQALENAYLQRCLK